MSVLMKIERVGILTWGLLREMIIKFVRDQGLFLASGLAFSLLLYSLPLALVMISVLGYTVLESKQALEEVQSVIRQFLPQSEQVFSQNVAAVVADRGLLGIVGFLGFVALSTTLFGFIRHVLNLVFKAGPARSLWRGTARDLLMMGFCILLLLGAISLASLFALAGSADIQLPGLAGAWGHGLGMIHRILGIALGGSLILGIYRFSPVKTLRLSSLAVGTGVVIVLFGLAKHMFVWYVLFAQGNIALYGALGAFLFFFMWLFYASVVFVLGAEAAWVFDHRERLLPEATARRRPQTS